jgi:hypothetical protein
MEKGSPSKDYLRNGALKSAEFANKSIQNTPL